MTQAEPPMTDSQDPTTAAPLTGTPTPDAHPPDAPLEDSAADTPVAPNPQADPQVDLQADSAANPEPDADAPPQDEPPSPEARIAELEAELAKANENVLRALADAENTRARTRRDMEAARKFAVEPLARELLTALDHLGRARRAVSPEMRAGDETLSNLYVGVEMTEKELLKAFDKYQIQQIDPAGEPFDPNHHQALQHVEGTEAASGTVIEVVAPGYQMHGRLLRAAMVLVAK